MQVSRARRPVANHFLALHAIGPGDAVAFVPQNDGDRAQFEQMRAAGIIHEAIRGHYWLDLPKLKADEDARRTRLVPVAIVVAVIAALVLTLFYRG
ncbi:hypothetical protein [Sphingomonas sp. G-3-2-10]|uniref:hypothetical protein n=1 Tax=Sphingomonas sp. G-3-2-10 TaxID=2728838 RepID=UPI00146CF1DA|nr:hypothetical protein [Sphingomonas sp. G-3-2-10]NML06030.1 hypothetical protein [Sphingomonas sp. G-3-2-10]